jgi:hypothetical protein
VQEQGWRLSGEGELRLEGQEAKGVKRKTGQGVATSFFFLEWEVRIFCLPLILSLNCPLVNFFPLLCVL